MNKCRTALTRLQMPQRVNEEKYCRPKMSILAQNKRQQAHTKIFTGRLPYLCRISRAGLIYFGRTLSTVIKNKTYIFNEPKPCAKFRMARISSLL